MKKLDLYQLLHDQGIPFTTSPNGWLQMECPFCYKGDRKKGLGYSPTGVFNCYKCGKLKRWETVAALTKTTLQEAKELCRRYTGETFDKALQASPDDHKRPETISLPYGTDKLTSRHIRYLRSRGFGKKIIRRWKLKGTGVFGKFANRIIIPFYNRIGDLVAYQGRDITGKSEIRYKNVPDKDAITSVKNCLYGEHLAPNGKGSRVVITEGVTKVWRLGPGSVATCGVKVTNAQIRKLATYERRYILFDLDEAGRESAKQLSKRLSLFPGTTTIVRIKGVKDAADMTPKQAKTLMKKLV